MFKQLCCDCTNEWKCKGKCKKYISTPINHTCFCLDCLLKSCKSLQNAIEFRGTKFYYILDTIGLINSCYPDVIDIKGLVAKVL